MWFAYYINTSKISVYFQKTCTQIIPRARIKEVNVFILMPSPIKNQVKTAYELIPNAKPRNLPGHNKPSK